MTKHTMNRELHEFLEDNGGANLGCVYLKDGKQRDEFFNHFKERYPDTTFDKRHHNIKFLAFGKSVKFSTEGHGARGGCTTINLRSK